MKCSSLQALVLRELFSSFRSLRTGQAQSTKRGQSAGGKAKVATSDTGATNQPHDDRFVIGNDDVLAISVWNEPNLTKSVPVHVPTGKISLPLVGEMQASGKTPVAASSATSLKNSRASSLRLK